MNIIPVFLTAASDLGMGERASTAGIVTLQGMLTVFLVLSILWAAIEVMHRILHKDKKETKKESAPVAAPAPVATPAPAPVEAQDDGAIVAAITAAIMAMRSESGESSAFRVVSFKRANRK